MAPSFLQHVPEILRHCGLLGFTSFGGPSVHFLILHKKFVQELAWIDEATYQELFALGSASPGPASTTMVFSIASLRGGLFCGFVAFFLWSLPAAMAMLGLALGIRQINDILPEWVYHLLSGLNAAVVGLIAQAGYALAKKAATDTTTVIVLSLSAAIATLYSSQWLYPVLVVSGGLVSFISDNAKAWSEPMRMRFGKTRQQAGLQVEQPEIELESLQTPSTAQLRRRTARDVPDVALPSSKSLPPTTTAAVSQAESPLTEATNQPQSHMYLNSLRTGYITLAVFALILILTLSITSAVKNPARAILLFRNMLLGGTIIFGGGPVVIPLLSTYVVDPGWVSVRDFLIGLSIIQAFPGPNFNFAVYLGALTLNKNPVGGAFLAWLGIFLPGLLLRVGILPFWSVLRRYQATRQILRGVTAAAVGLIFAAIYRFCRTTIITPPPATGEVNGSQNILTLPWFTVVAGLTFVLLEKLRCPPALAVLLGAVAGVAEYGVAKGSPMIQSFGRVE
ncbi:chromate transporter-domain-containing protein [Protomyces lactucae-debilis]|uniref:Chromate transporter-domain-containing protein n=1 Tax=Protomyces lactucae-debilis TaxID=2754530 RepID=A0A1Y2F3U9_PROLT|nr:chromate transporter-domain-containing protein [Protomyces lactucae-debilis]ORY78580.1 chromate transporter-domain-containing protein [Protomyces lactucae-debilis]